MRTTGPVRAVRALLLGAALCAVAGCSGESTAAPSFMRVPVGDSPVRGPADAWVTLVEYADFQCPGCRWEAPRLLQLEAAYPDDLRVVFKQYPLSYHAHAGSAAVAAECARAQGRFWEMHDRLFTTADLTDAGLQAAAQTVGLDLAAWTACRADPAAAQRVDADEALGIQLGVQGTPWIVVNGVPVVQDAVPDLDQLKALVQSALEKAQASGIPKARYYDQAVMGQ